MMTAQVGCKSTSLFPTRATSDATTMVAQKLKSTSAVAKKTRETSGRVAKSSTTNSGIGLVNFVEPQENETESLPADSPKDGPIAIAVPDEMDVTPQDDQSTTDEPNADRMLVLPPEPKVEFNIGLTLPEVLASVAQCYPEIDIAIGEVEAANGKVLASWGEFDQMFAAHSISQPLGFYQTYRNGAGLTQPLFGGGEVYGTYRNGDGNFEPWFGERETNEGGEFKAGFSIPLLKDRNIDARRAQLFTAGFQRDQVEANVDLRLLLFQRFATQAYWDWVAAGQVVQIQTRLLRLAEDRVDKIADLISSGDQAKIVGIDNSRFIAKRKNDLIKAKRLVEKAAIKLSMFVRDGACNPVVVEDSLLPSQFPDSDLISTDILDSDIATALTVRPELRELRAACEEVAVSLEYAQNLTLPKIDVKGFAGQDIGGETSSKGDKTPFELQLGVLAEVPIQRREGRGKIAAARGKLKQIEAKTQLVSDKIRAEVQDAASAVNAAFDQIQQSQENLRLTRQSLELGIEAFNSGEIDLIALNIYETSVAEAELELLDARFKYFFYRAIYETAIRGEANGF